VTFNESGGNVDLKAKTENAASFFTIDGEEDLISITGPADDGVFLTFGTNSKSLLNLTGTNVIFNEGGNNIGLKIEGDTKPNLFKTWAVGDSVTVDGDLSVSGELKVGTFSVTEASYDSIQIGGTGDYLSVYFDTTFLCTLTNLTTTEICSTRVVQCGNVVSAFFSYAVGEYDGSGLVDINGYPPRFQANRNTYLPLPVYASGSSPSLGYVDVGTIPIELRDIALDRIGAATLNGLAASSCVTYLLVVP
jgi:hypothetical protein